MRKNNYNFKKAFFMLLGSFATLAQAQKIAVTEVGRYTDGRETASEIVTYDSSSKKLFITNAVTDSIDIVDITNPAAPMRTGGIDIAPYGGGVNSVVSLGNGYIAAAIEASVKQDSGKIVFFTTAGVFAKELKVGALPDMVTMSKDGKKVLAACEGEPNDAYTVDPEGNIAIINISAGIPSLTQSDVKLLRFDKAPMTIAGSLHKPGTTWAQDLEPEYIAINEANTLAAVSCQEANVMIMVDLTADTILSYKGLGFKDHSLAGNGFDASDKDKKINITTHPVKGVYMPDAIAAYTVSGKTYYLSANEGDGRDYGGYTSETRVKSLTLDPTAFPTGAALKNDTALGRLKTFTTDVIGDTDGDGDVDEIYTYGARSFSIWNDAGALVYDSGDDFEQYIAANHDTFFNCTDGVATKKDDRSDDKGPEPEAMTVGTVGPNTFAFIGLERQGGIMIYDITNPASPVFDTFVHSYQSNGTMKDAAPEGIIFVPAAHSHTGENMLIVANEFSGTTAIYEVKDLTPTSLRNVANDEQLVVNVFPNPTSKQLTISLNKTVVNKHFYISVFNTMGQKVKVEPFSLNSNNSIINIEELPTGLYYLHLTDAEQASVAKPVAVFKK